MFRRDRSTRQHSSKRIVTKIQSFAECHLMQFCIDPFIAGNVEHPFG